MTLKCECRTLNAASLFRGCDVSMATRVSLSSIRNPAVEGFIPNFTSLICGMNQVRGYEMSAIETGVDSVN